MIFLRKAMLEKYSVILKNFSYLSILEVIKLLFPLITIPYLMNKLGTFNYGTIAFVQSIMAYSTIIINLGLDLSSVKDISCNRDNKTKLDEIVSSVLIIKFTLFSIICLSVFLLTYLIPFFISNRLLMMFSLSYCLMEIVFPVWYYQGIEKMKYITWIRLISVIIYSLLILCFIKFQDDYLYVPVFYGIGALCGGVFSFYILTKKEKIRLYLPKIKTLVYYLKSTFILFLSRLSAVINTTFAKIISGIFLGMEQVAILDLLDKITGIAKIPLVTINNSIYPYIARTKDKKIVHQLFKITIGISVFINAIIFFSANFILDYFSDSMFNEYSYMLQIFSFNILICGLSYFLGTPVLVSFGHSKYFTMSVLLSTALLFILYLFAIVPGLTVMYCILISLIVEIFVLLFRYICCKKEAIL